MDADDVALKDRLMRQVEFMESHPEVGVLGGAMELIDGMGKFLLTTECPVEDRDIRSVLLRDNPFAQPAVIIRKEAFVSVGGYREVFAPAEDCDLWLRIAERSQLANLRVPVLKYRVHPGQISKSKLQQQTLSALASRAAASSRRTGGADPFNSVKEITPAVLAHMGISEATQQRALLAAYLNWINRMCDAHQDSAALDLAIEMLRSSRWQHIARRVMADVWLRTAGLYWGQDQFFLSLVAVGHAMIVRPAVAGRPAKQLLHWLGTAFGVGEASKAHEGGDSN
jgi:hypothetical protein